MDPQATPAGGKEPLVSEERERRQLLDGRKKLPYRRSNATLAKASVAIMHNTARLERFVRRDVRMRDSLQSLVQRAGDPDGVSVIAGINRDELPDLTKSQRPSFNDWSWANERAILNLAPLPTSTGRAVQRTEFADTTVAERCSFQPCSEISAWSVATQIQGISIPLPLASAALKIGSGIPPINHAPRERDSLHQA